MLQFPAGFCQLLGDIFLGALQLVVFFEIALGIFLGALVLAERNGDFLSVIVVFTGQLVLAALQRIAVGVEKLAVYPVFVLVRGVLQLLFLNGQFFAAALQKGIQYLAKIRGLLPDPGILVLGLVEAADHSGHGIKAFLAAADIILKLTQVDGRKVQGLPILVYNIRLGLFLQHRLGQDGPEAVVEPGQGLWGLTVGGEIRIHGGAEADFVGGQGTQAGDVMENSLEHRFRLTADQGNEAFLRQCEGVLLPLGVRNEVGTVRQHLPERGLGNGDALNGIDDGEVLPQQDNVGILTHELDGQNALSEVSHFIQMLDFEEDDPLQTGGMQGLLGLADGQNGAVADVLPECHAEGGGSDRC